MLTRDVDIFQRPWSSQQAFQHCERITSGHYENFPVASLFIPRDRRKYVSSIYAFARTADDFADEPGMTPAERIESLNLWEEQLNECVGGNPRNPVFIALAETIDRFQIPPDLLRNLLQAFRQDVIVHRYHTFDDVLQYCQNSANPVGRIVLLLFNYRSEAMHQYADPICTALQLTNFWQDVAVDLEKDRVYVPLEDISECGYSEENLLSRQYTAEFRDVLSLEVGRTRDLFIKGKPLLSDVGKDLSLELQLTWNGGMRILEKIEDQDFNVFRRRPRLTWWDTIGALFNSLLR